MFVILLKQTSASCAINYLSQIAFDNNMGIILAIISKTFSYSVNTLSDTKVSAFLLRLELKLFISSATGIDAFSQISNYSSGENFCKLLKPSKA